jgi:hypothetical protein
VPDPVCEPAQVEERHAAQAEKAMIAASLHCKWGVDDCDRCVQIKGTLALAFAEQEREVRRATLEDAADALEQLERNMNYGPSLQDALLVLRALPQSGRSGSE